MDDLIVSYLLLTGECTLPGIGKISLTHGNAVCDLASKELLPPEDSLQFSESTSGDMSSLVSFIASNSNCSNDEAQEKFRSWTKGLTETLNRNKEVPLPLLGKFVKDSNGDIFFKSTSALSVFRPVRAERVIHEAASHEVLVGDKVATKDEMREMLSNGTSDEDASKKFWKPAIIIFALAMIIILLYFIFNGSGSGITSHDTPASYFLK